MRSPTTSPTRHRTGQIRRNQSPHSAAVLPFAVGLTLFLLTACASVNQFATYRPPGQNTNLGIEVTSQSHTPPIFELKINGQHVMELRWTMSDYHRAAVGTYNGKPVEMKGRFIPGGHFVIDVFINNDRAANFVF